MTSPSSAESLAPSREFAEWILGSSSDGRDPFAGDFLKLARRLCDTTGLEFKLLEPDLGKEDYRDRRGAQRWELEIEPAAAGTEPSMEVARKGVVVGGEVVARPRVRLTLVGLPPWERLPSSEPENVRTAFDRLAVVYGRYLAEKQLGDHPSFDDVLIELRLAQKALYEGLADGSAGDDGAELVNRDVARWLERQPDVEVVAFSPAEARDRGQPARLLVVPRHRSVSVCGFVVRRKGRASGDQEAMVIPAIGNPGPPAELSPILTAFESEQLPSAAAEHLRMARAGGADLWPQRSLPALIQAYLAAERAGLEEHTLRHLARQLAAAGVMLTEKDRPYPAELSDSSSATYRWDPAASGTVLEVGQTGLSFDGEPVSVFEGTISLGPPPYLWTWLKDHPDIVDDLPDPRQALSEPESFLDQLFHVFFERYASFPIRDRLRLVRRILDGRCETPSEVRPQSPGFTGRWSTLSVEERLRALGPRPNLELTYTLYPELAKSAVDLLPGLEYVDFRTYAILDVHLPVDSSLHEKLSSPEAESLPLIRRLVELVLKVRARNVAFGAFHDPLGSGSSTERSRLRDRIRETLRGLHAALQQDAVAAEWAAASLLDELFESAADDGDWLSVEAIRAPTFFSSSARPDAERCRLGFEFSGRQPFGHLIRGFHGLEVAGDVAAPALATLSLGELPPELSALETWLTEALTAFAVDARRFKEMLESSRGTLVDLRAGGAEARRQFVDVARFLQRRCGDVRLIDEVGTEGTVTVRVAADESVTAGLPLLEQETFLPGLRLGDQIIVPPAGEAVRRAHPLELRLVQELDGKAGDEVVEIFHRSMGDLEQLPPAARLELFELYAKHASQPNAELGARLLISTPYRILAAGDRLPVAAAASLRDVTYDFNSAAFGTVLSVEPFTVVREPGGEIELQAPLRLSCGPRGSGAHRLSSLLEERRSSVSLREQIHDVEARIGRLGPSADYPARMGSFLIELVEILYQPECLRLGDRRTLLTILEGIAEEGFWSCEPRERVKTIHIASVEGELEMSARPSVCLRTASGEHELEGVEILNHRPPASLVQLWRELGDPEFREDDATILEEAVAWAVLEHLNTLGGDALSSWASRFGAQRVAELKSFCGLELILEAEAAKATEMPAEERPWSLYDTSEPGQVSIHQAGYCLGGDSRPLIWSRSLGPLPAEIDSYLAARPLVERFFPWFMPTFEAEMGAVLEDADHREKLRQLISQWHKEIILDMVDLAPTSLVARVHRSVYRTIERWPSVPDFLRDRTLRELQQIYGQIEKAYGSEPAALRKPRVVLVKCEPGQLIDHTNQERFELETGKAPHLGTSVAHVASGLEIQLMGRFETIKCIVRTVNKRTPGGG